MLSHTVYFQTIDTSLFAMSLSNLPGNVKAGQVEKGKNFQPITENLNEEKKKKIEGKDLSQTRSYCVDT